jgi:hypothetical protein
MPTSSRKKYKKYMKNSGHAASGDSWGVLLFAGCVVLGLALGALQAKNLDASALNAIQSQVDWRFSDSANRVGLFLSGAIKNGGSLLLIWITAFIPMGGLISIVIIFIRAMGYGYTLTALAQTYATGGGFGILAALGVQCVILLTAAFLLCSAATQFGGVFKDKKQSVTGKEVLAYCLALLTCEAVVMLASLL